MLLCEHKSSVTKTILLAGEKSDDMKHFGGVTPPINPALFILNVRKL